MGAEYCQATDVKRILQSAGFSTSSSPTQAEIEKNIESVQDFIDKKTNRTWLTAGRTITNEYYDISRIRYDVSTGLSIYLKKRFIKTLDSEEGDKIEIWNGSAYEDYVTTKTESRASDFWLDYETGILYLKSFYNVHFIKALRMTYRYGEDSVPNDIRDATALFVASRIITSDDRTMLLAETGDPTRMTHDDRAGRWFSEAMRLIHNYIDASSGR